MVILIACLIVVIGFFIWPNFPKQIKNMYLERQVNKEIDEEFKEVDQLTKLKVHDKDK